MAGEVSTAHNATPGEFRVLVLPFTAADAQAIRKVLGANDIAAEICSSVTQLCLHLAAGAGLLIVSEEVLPGGADELAACVAGQPVWSDLPLIILSKAGRESNALGDTLARLGNVSVVERPVRTSTLLSLVRSSLRARERQYQVREYLARQEQAQRTIRSAMESERVARSEAERASRTKDEFLATLSHELRTPLNSVLGWAHVLCRSQGLSSEVTNGLAVIERNARAQARIIEDLLDMSSIISGKVQLKLRPLDVASVIHASLESIRPTLEAKGIRLRVDLD